MTYIAGYEPSTRHPNIKVVLVPGVQIFENMPNLFTTDVHTGMSAIFDDLKKVCTDALGHEGVQRLRKEKFDLLILHMGLTECFLTFAHELQVCNILKSLPNNTLTV